MARSTSSHTPIFFFIFADRLVTPPSRSSPCSSKPHSPFSSNACGRSIPFSFSSNQPARPKHAAYWRLLLDCAHRTISRSACDAKAREILPAASWHLHEGFVLATRGAIGKARRLTAAAPEPSSSGAPPSSPKTAAKEASRRRVEEARARLRAQDVDDTGKVTNPNPRVDDYTRVEDTVRVRVDVGGVGGVGVCGGDPSRFDLSGRFATARLATPANVVNANLESQLRYSFQDERAEMKRLRSKKQRLDAFTVTCSKFTARGTELGRSLGSFRHPTLQTSTPNAQPIPVMQRALLTDTNDTVLVTLPVAAPILPHVLGYSCSANTVVTAVEPFSQRPPRPWTNHAPSISPAIPVAFKASIDGGAPCGIAVHTQAHVNTHPLERLANAQNYVLAALRGRMFAEARTVPRRGESASASGAESGEHQFGAEIVETRLTGQTKRKSNQGDDDDAVPQAIGAASRVLRAPSRSNPPKRETRVSPDANGHREHRSVSSPHLGTSAPPRGLTHAPDAPSLLPADLTELLESAFPLFPLPSVGEGSGLGTGLGTEAGSNGGAAAGPPPISHELFEFLSVVPDANVGDYGTKNNTSR